MYRIRTFGVFMLAALMAVAASAIGHAPAVHAQASPTAPAPLATFRGSYDGFSTPLALGPFHLNAGVTVLRARHNGQANFVVSLRMPDPGVDPQVYTLNTYLMVDAIGRFDGGAVQMVPQEGDYYLLLSANGAYDLSVEQPSPTTVSPVIQNTFSGRGQQVTPYELDRYLGLL